MATDNNNELKAVPQPPKHYTEPKVLNVNGLATAYRRQGSGEPVLFLHGAGLTRMWLPMYARCAESVDFIAPEHPGFGATARPDWLIGFEDLVVHYDQFLSQLDIDNFHLVGYSVGGWLASEFAAYYPRRLKSLTLITPIGLRLVDNPGPDIFQFNPDELVAALFNDMSAFEAITGDPDDFEEINQAHSEMATLAKLIWAPRYNLALEWRLKRVSCPALMIKAENDRLVPNEMPDRFAEILPNASTQTIARTGHALVVENPDDTADAIVNFVKGVT